MEFLSVKNRDVKYLLCVIDVFITYAWVKLLKDKNDKAVFNGFIKLVSESNRNTNESWVDQGKQFYNWFMQKWLDNNDILMYFTHNEG